MLLAEDHLALRTVQRLPGAHPTFQGAPRPDAEAGVTAQHLAQDADRPQTWGRLQQRDDLAVPDCRQRVRPATTAWRARLRRQSRVAIDPGAGGGAEPRPRGGGLTRMGATKFHVQSHLLVRYVFAGHRGAL